MVPETHLPKLFSKITYIMKNKRCEGSTTKGKKCKRQPLFGTCFCYYHDEIYQPKGEFLKIKIKNKMASRDRTRIKLYKNDIDKLYDSIMPPDVKAMIELERIDKNNYMKNYMRKRRRRKKHLYNLIGL